MMWGDDYLPPGHNPQPDGGSLWVTALLIAAAIGLILTCLPWSAS
jgi:hypothetical protein